jgi:hypothetical protein
MTKKWNRIERTWKEDGAVTLGGAFSQLAVMLDTFALITGKLSLSVDNLLVKSMLDFRSRDIKTVHESSEKLRKATDEYEVCVGVNVFAFELAGLEEGRALVIFFSLMPFPCLQVM